MRRHRQVVNIRYTSNQRHRTRPWRSIIGTDLAGTTVYCVSNGVHLLSCLSAYVMNSRQVRCAKHEMCFALSMLLLVQNRHTLLLAKCNTVHGDTSLAVFLVVAALALLLHWLLVCRSSWFCGPFCLFCSGDVENGNRNGAIIVPVWRGPAKMPHHPNRIHASSNESNHCQASRRT